MKKLAVLAVLLLSLWVTACGAPVEETNAPPDRVPVSEGVVDAPEAVIQWAQYEIDQLVRMLETDGFYGPEGTERITVDILESRINGLRLEKELAFFQKSSIQLYALDFRLQPGELPEEAGFVLDEEGWIPSDHNFTYSDAQGAELKKGQLYLLITQSGGEPSGIGIRRTEKDLTEEWCADLQAYFGYPPGVWFDSSPEAIQAILDYWKWDEEWSFSMPNENWADGDWSIGLGYAHEWGLGIPYKFLGWEEEPAQDLVALSFAIVQRRYYEGLTVVTFDGFYGDDQVSPNFSPIQYIACAQPDCKTSRGVSVGDSVQAVQEAYPEAFWSDSCLVYGPEGSNRSILFIIEDGVVIQIDMADGLDGRYETPAGIIPAGA